MNATYTHVQDPSIQDTSINPRCSRRIVRERETIALQTLTVSGPYNAEISSVSIVLALLYYEKRNQQSICFLQLS